MSNRFEWLTIRLEYLIPVISVLLFASILVFFTYMANVTMKAVIVAEEGGSGQQASAGILNALIYIIPAIIGGFIIAMLFKYRKQYTLKAFFGSAIFFATTFITFFFFEIVIFVLQLKSFGMIIVNPSVSFISFRQPYLVFYPLIGFLIIPVSVVMGILVAYIISSPKFLVYTKNHALLFLGGLMGAFLAVILPTWTVVFMLVGLSLYDIYSVGHGPIREIMELTYGPEEGASSQSAGQPKASAPQAPTKPVPATVPLQAGAAVPEPRVVNVKPAPVPVKVLPKPTEQFSRADDDLLSNMTYGTAHWDLGIGDLVFYSMLGSHTLMYGTQFIEDFGIWAPLSLFLLTTMGIILGFVITLRLLKRNSMLPGLPMSIGLGLIGFVIGVGILHLL
jgi:hypothetical protein